MKIVTIIGARPQFIKAATISRLIKKSIGIDEFIVHTGQHFDSNMSDIFFKELDIPEPNFHLGIGGGNHGEQTGKMLQAIEKVLLDEKPDWVLVYGDTNSTLAGALAAAKLHIPVAHVEAGLRSFNKKMPEEINRILTDHISSILFSPTETASKNLISEGIEVSNIREVGDVMFDAALYYAEKSEKESTIISKLNLKRKGYILATIHRAENTDNSDRLLHIFAQLEQLSKDYNIVLPLHPRTKKNLDVHHWDFKNSKINFIDPVGYLDMVMLEKNSQLIITDSGGVQKEAFFHHVPCITLRNETEWVELVNTGFNTLIIDISTLPNIVSTSLSKSYNFERHNLYGNGDASSKIVKILKQRT
jgi:UDP-GlcNAc3NAcA epimerase